ncbi:MAG: hypothetical protein R2762_06940 [Bryobacteraceae bacterium]
MRATWFVLAAALPAFGQSEQALKAFFEGKQVRVKIDMPATHDGVDVTPGRTPAIDFRSYSQRVKNAGTALRNGDSVMVTLVRVKSKNIEFQLGGGGYGTAGDESASVSLPSVSKSRRESDLEKSLKTEKDPKQRDAMSRELSRLKDSRQREETYRRAEQTRLTEMKKIQIREKALQAGSRFNIWFPSDRLKEAVPDPPELMAMLAEYVEFDAAGDRSAPAQRLESSPGIDPPDRLLLTVVKRGQTRGTVHERLGKPEAVRDRQEGSLTVHEERFLTPDEIVEVEFINDVVVRYRITSR